ncbi:hypothetical protein EJV47_25940 [Hymenobacter gummosus]|uniref:Uncharacterized protein n=1 Tax=Hymenobacter gummosus TaxID=1776032 RepID=A0A3S0JAE2_9BACT|nr:hypothetical protein [Hymenobacter gummosus]RTQ45316.1 hypothetical protein EJV47_25940 [Hymenobacter gummosus]
MRVSTPFSYALLFLGLAGGLSSCERPTAALAPDPALLGRWELVPYNYPGAPQQRQSLEFGSDGVMRAFRHDTLHDVRAYELRRPTNDLEAGPDDHFVALDGYITQVYRIKRDTLYWNTVSYKNMINCFPVNLRFARTAPQPAKPQ